MDRRLKCYIFFIQKYTTCQDVSKMLIPINVNNAQIEVRFYVKKYNAVLWTNMGDCEKLTKIAGLLDLFIVKHYNVLTVNC